MREEFLKSAEHVRYQLEAIIPADQLATDWLYQTILKLIDEVKLQKFTSSKTSIGLAAMKLNDLGFSFSDSLVDEIIHLGWLYRRMQK